MALIIFVEIMKMTVNNQQLYLQRNLAPTGSTPSSTPALVIHIINLS